MWWSVWDRKPAKTSIIRAAQPPGVRRQRVPLGHVRVVPGQLGVGRDHAELLLPGEDPLPVGVPAVVEPAPVPVRPLLGHVVRGVRRAGAEVQVERLVRGDLLGVGDERDRLVGQVRGQVVALLGSRRRLDLVVVGDQVRIPLAGVAAEEAVEAVEAPAQRPPVVRTGRRLLLGRHQVPLADHVGVVAVLGAASPRASRSRTGSARRSRDSRWPAR